MSKENTLVSIITPCFNSEKTIRKTIESVINQSYKNIEYIIIDGGSVDNTLSIINEYSSCHPNITVVSEKDYGVYDAMNKGIHRSSGKLIGIINADDWYEEDAVEKIVKNYEYEKYAVLYGFSRYWKNGLEEKIVLFSHNNLENQMISHPAAFVTTETYKDYGLFDLKYRSSSDYDFMLRMKRNGVKFIPVYELVANFTLGGLSSGYVGVIETAEILCKNGIITNKRLVATKIKVFVHKLYKKMKGRNL